MSTIPAEVISKLSNIQNQIWQTVSMTASESAGQSITFGNPLTVVTSPGDLYSEMAAPKLVVQFAFTSTPEQSHILLFTQEMFAEFAAMIKDEKIDEIDDNLVGDIRPLIEAVVQGICLAVGTIKNDAIVASGLTARFQIFNFPPNMQRADELIRTNVVLTSDNLSGTATWLIDNETAHWILNMPVADPNDETPFENLPTTGGTQKNEALANEDANSLEILMDIPLEISVELGRMKMLVRDVVDLGTGSIVEIDKVAGDPVDVMVNGRLVARGEVVVIEDNFGVRITEILSVQERLARLNQVA